LASVSDRRRPGQAPRRNQPRAAGGAAARGVARAGGQSATPHPLPAAPGTGPSWHYAKHVSALLHPEADTRLSRRHVRYAQRGILWRESRLERVRKCGRVPVGTEGNQVAVKRQAGVCHYSGLASCGSIWACPVCSAKIRNTRASEISEATAAWDRAGHSVYMVTLTAPHDLGDRLAPLLATVADGFRAVISGRPWIRLRKQLAIAGTIRSVEVTHGVNGWHPHLHVLLFLDRDPGAEGLATLAAHIRGRWGAFIVSQGYRPPDRHHGVVIDRCTSAAEAGAYIAKTQDGASPGNELARADLKQGRNGHRTPLEILEAFRWTGVLEDLALWHEYEKASKGHQAITWSKGLHQLLAVEDRSDEEVAAEEVGGEIVALIAAETWREVTRIPGLPAHLLDEAERGGAPGIKAALARHGFGTDPGP
jgi:hypothetical protein